MKSVKFMSAKVPINCISSMGTALTKLEYSKNNPQGYANIDIEQTYFESDFVERISTKRQLTDPIGRKYTSRYVVGHCRRQASASRPTASYGIPAD